MAIEDPEQAATLSLYTAVRAVRYGCCAAWRAGTDQTICSLHSVVISAKVERGELPAVPHMPVWIFQLCCTGTCAVNWYSRAPARGTDLFRDHVLLVLPAAHAATVIPKVRARWHGRAAPSGQCLSAALG
jgi:hypothetical protein